jgi:hypothetical protein
MTETLKALAFVGAILGCVQLNDGKQVPAWITDNPDGSRTVRFVEPVLSWPRKSSLLAHPRVAMV